MEGFRRADGPHIDDLADDDARLCGFSFSQLVEEELEVTDYSHRPLPALLHPGGFGHLEHTRRSNTCAKGQQQSHAHFGQGSLTLT